MPEFIEWAMGIFLAVVVLFLGILGYMMVFRPEMWGC